MLFTTSDDPLNRIKYPQSVFFQPIPIVVTLGFSLDSRANGILDVYLLLIYSFVTALFFKTYFVFFFKTNRS